jgi:hypothetical protein
MDGCRAVRPMARMSDWLQVGGNLVKHRAGTIYLRAKGGGKVIRWFLKTTGNKPAQWLG